MLPLHQQFGEIDIYVFDQLLKGRIAPGMTVLDAGCGGGRNLVYLLREGYRVFACDIGAAEVDDVRALALELNPSLPASNFRVEPVEAMTFPDALADVVLCNTVLHFARDDAHFQAMLDSLWRVLAPGGILFCRLGSTIGMESQVVRIAERIPGQPCDVQSRRFKSPDGSERYLVDAEQLLAHTHRLGAQLADPIKTTVVHAQRSMTTWVLRKNAPPRA